MRDNRFFNFIILRWPCSMSMSHLWCIKFPFGQRGTVIPNTQEIICGDLENKRNPRRSRRSDQLHLKREKKISNSLLLPRNQPHSPASTRTLIVLYEIWFFLYLFHYAHCWFPINNIYRGNRSKCSISRNHGFWIYFFVRFIKWSTSVELLKINWKESILSSLSAVHLDQRKE